MSSQVIAEIFEYRGMFTTDVRQKLKRWKDGKVAYHRFNGNRKIFVYTEDGQLVSEKMLEKSQARILEEEQFGVEFKVGGILVTIDELTGTGEKEVGRAYKQLRADRSSKPAEPQSTTAVRTAVPPTVITRTPASITKFSSTPLTLNNTMRRRKVGLSRNDTPSKRARPTQVHPSSRTPELLRPSTVSCPPVESPSSHELVRLEPLVSIRLENNKPPQTTATSPKATKQVSTSHVPLPKTPAAIQPRSVMRRVVDRATPSKCTLVPPTTRVQNTPMRVPETEQQPKSTTSTPSLLQKFLEEDEGRFSSSPHDPHPTRSTNSAPQSIPTIIVKPEPTPSPKRLPPVEDPITISWGTQNDTTALAQRLTLLHQESLKSSSSPAAPLPAPPVTAATRIATPRPRIGRTVREHIRVEQPTPARTPAANTPMQRTPLQNLQKNTLLKVPQRFETPMGVTSINSKKLQRLRESKNGLLTPASAKSKINVYVSDDSDDEIVETQIPKKLSVAEKITQTETYNYGGRGHRVSHLGI